MNGNLDSGRGGIHPDVISIPDDQEELPTLGLIWSMAWALVRVGLVLAIWLALQMGMFLGLFTIPLVMLMLFSAAWFVLDIGRNYPKMIARWRNRKRAGRRW